MKKILSAMLSFALVILVFSGCSQQKTQTVDREGNMVKIPEKIEKIISTAPSNSEILVGLGLADKVVCVDGYAAVEGIPDSVTKMDFTKPDAEAIIKMAPDIVIASEFNRAGQDSPFDVLVNAGITVVYLPTSNSFDDIYKDIQFISEVTKTEKNGQKLIADMKTSIEKIQKKAEGIQQKKKVYFEISPAPSLYSFGNNTYMNEMLKTIGAENIFAAQDSWISPSEEAVIKANPDVILTNVNFIDNPVGEIKSRPGWNTISAVANNQVYSIDTNSSSRPTQNAVKALEEMAKAVYPEIYE